MNLSSFILAVFFVAGSVWLISTLPSELREGQATFRSYRATRIDDPVNYWLFLGIKPLLAAAGVFVAISLATNPI